MPHFPMTDGLTLTGINYRRISYLSTSNVFPNVFYDTQICHASIYYALPYAALSLTIAARNLFEAKRPVEFDKRLQPMTDMNSGSYG